MSKKKQIVQEMLSSDDDWGDFMGRKGLKVVDAFSQWCGPCTALSSVFKKLKTDVADDLLQLATADADAIGDLDKYRGTCRPQILFYGGDGGKNTLVWVVRGADGPTIERVAKDLLEKEHDAIENGAERVEFEDKAAPAVAAAAAAAASEADKGAKDEADEAAPAKTFIVVLVKASVANGEGAEERMDEIHAAVAEAGLRVADTADVDFDADADAAKAVFASRERLDGYDELVSSCAGGPCKLLALSATGDVTAAELWARLAAAPPEGNDAATEETAGDGDGADKVPKGEGEGEGDNAAEGGNGDPGAVTKSVIFEKYADGVVASASDDEAKAQIEAFFAELAKEVYPAPAPETGADGSGDGGAGAGVTDGAAAGAGGEGEGAAAGEGGSGHGGGAGEAPAAEGDGKGASGDGAAAEGGGEGDAED